MELNSNPYAKSGLLVLLHLCSASALIIGLSDSYHAHDYKSTVSAPPRTRLFLQHYLPTLPRERKNNITRMQIVLWNKRYVHVFHALEHILQNLKRFDVLRFKYVMVAVLSAFLTVKINQRIVY